MSMDSYDWADAAYVLLSGVILVGVCALFIYVGCLLARYSNVRRTR